MSDVYLGRELAIEICRVFNLDPGKVNRLTIDLPADGVARVKVSRYIGKGEGEELITLFNKHQIKTVELKEYRLLLNRAIIFIVATLYKIGRNLRHLRDALAGNAHS